MFLDFPRLVGLGALSVCIVAGVSLVPRVAFAQRLVTGDAFERLEEILEMRQEDGLLDARDVLPIILVSAQPKYLASQGWYEVRALAALTRVFGGDGVRSCEACMRPRTSIEERRIEQTIGPVSLDEIIRMDDRYRGDSPRARTAIWIDETSGGIAVRIADLRSARIVFAQNIDPDLLEYRGAARSFRLAAELERRTRGESLTHAHFDLGLYPGQHISMEWADQWGAYNDNLSGVVLSFFDPVFGIGASYYRALEWRNVAIGGQAILSIPTVVAQAASDSDVELLDPQLTAVFVLRIPFGHSNYAGLLTVSTNGQVALGLSFLNTSLIPILP